MATAPGSGRSAWKLLIILGAIVAGVGGFFVITTRSVLDPDRFGANIAASLSDDRVAQYVASQLTDAIISQRPNLLAVRRVASRQSPVPSPPDSGGATWWRAMPSPRPPQSRFPGPASCRGPCR